VKEVSWYGAACYCDWRSMLEGLTPFYNGDWSVSSDHNPYTAEGYRLPTEAEWEYAARYDDGRTYPWGESEPLGCNWANLNCVGWSRPVGLYPQGDGVLGHHDLIGNALEWCNDFYADSYVDESLNPLGAASSTGRVCRGSDFGDASLEYAMATTRQQYLTGYSASWIGFRTVKSEPVVQAYPGELILVPAGTFQMGQAGVAEPVHEVTLTQDYFLSKTEVTNEEYCAALNWALDQGLLEEASSVLAKAFGQELVDINGSSEIGWNGSEFFVETNANHPVMEVSWYGAACFTDWLSMMEGLEPYYNGNWNPSASHNPYEHSGYRLPTEAEWEYAARFDDGRTYPWGSDTPSPCLHANYYSCVGWTSAAGSYPAGNSALGFEDMAGNVWEWVNDWFASYPDSATTNPYGSENGSTRVMRGGSWNNSGDGYLQSAYRNLHFPYFTDAGIGFRILRR
jgi:formylglycine-generating enzyme required for sulfatase activity